MIRLAGEPYPVMRAFFASPFVTVAGIAFAVSAAYHMRIGMQVIIEDYIHAEGTKMVLLMLNTFFAAAVALTCIVSLIKLSLGA